MSRIRRHVSYANVVATLALIFALGTGGAYAATKLAANSVGTKQIKNAAVTRAKLAKGIASSLNQAASVSPAAGPAGPKGDPGAPGAKGDTGANGTSGTNGAIGTNGTNGKTVLNGFGTPDDTLGTDGDFYIDTTANAIYGPKSSGSWGSATSLVGPTGPSGATNKTIVTAPNYAVPAGGNASITPTCPSGKKAVGGGFSAVTILQVTGSYPVSGAESWEVDVHNNSTTASGEAHAYVVCVSP